MLESYVRAIRQMSEEICDTCRKKHGGCRGIRFCALLRYREKVVRVLNDLMERSLVH
jgi:hypothetical protein